MRHFKVNGALAPLAFCLLWLLCVSSLGQVVPPQKAPQTKQKSSSQSSQGSAPSASGSSQSSSDLHLLETIYRDVLETNRDTLETMRHLSSAVLTCITLVFAIVGGLTVYRSKVAEGKAAEAMALAETSRRVTIEVKAAVKAMESDLLQFREFLGTSKQDIQIARADISEIETSMASLGDERDVVLEEARLVRANLDGLASRAKELEETFARFRRIKKDELRLLADLHFIDSHLNILETATDKRRLKSSAWALLEKTHSGSPRIRRESIRALSWLKSPDDAVRERFREIANSAMSGETAKLVSDALESWVSTHDID